MLNISFIQWKNIIAMLILFDSLKFFINDSNEHIQENEEWDEYETKPEDFWNKSNFKQTIVHNSIPRFTGGATNEYH